MKQHNSEACDTEIYQQDMPSQYFTFNSSAQLFTVIHGDRSATAISSHQKNSWHIL